MCGIIGLVSLKGEIRRDWMEQAASLLRHRGPDGEGFLLRPPVALAHRRLAIIDLEGGGQPMSCPEGTVHIVFNGEIYNFTNLRQQLLEMGFAFRTKSDTEVLINAYKAWGMECLRYLRGMFAFIIYDEIEGKLIVSKDYLGKKSLFYFVSDDTFIAASEIEPILSHQAVSKGIDVSALDGYMGMGYIVGSRTIYASIRKVKPATYLEVKWGGGKIAVKEKTYWQLTYEPKWRLSETEAVNALEEKLMEAVRLRLVADVPVGALLSGGLDSGVVVGMASSLQGGGLLTFSVGFGEPTDELPLARATAQRWNTFHRELHVIPELEPLLSFLLARVGEPFDDSSLIPTYLISKLARQWVKVVLTGDGGDEALAGYSRYAALFFAMELRRLPSIFLEILHLIAHYFPFSRLKRLLVYDEDPSKLFFRYRCLPATQRFLYYTGDVQSFLESYFQNLWEEALSHTSNLLDAQLYAEIQSYLAYDLLPKLDIAAMTASLEPRSPFLDKEVMEFCARLEISFKAPPPTLLQRKWKGKYILRRLAERWLPAEVVHAPKRGFTPPIHQWMMNDLRGVLRETLLEASNPVYSYLSYDKVTADLGAYFSGNEKLAPLIWRLFILSLWFSRVYQSRSLCLYSEG
ncbi:MAG: asparagine synthase (glutamine-hydrolyzing) [Bacteroidia bacterium]|nr:asparagine synthase (glutamine-hydrolyzing) [Bacteroidia bacterium]MDW8015492.1 asparagine synthase (glutamine-hydrolyzing) [Bacteroidia bacterium]